MARPLAAPRNGVVAGYPRGVCFDLDSSPPIPVIAGAAVSHRDLILEPLDRARVMAFAAEPEESNGVGIVVLPDVRGLYSFYEEVALRFAERGYNAIAIDYFARTAGAEKRGEDFDYAPHVAQTQPVLVQMDVTAAVNWLRSEKGGGCTSIFTVGFCFGGWHSWMAAASGHGLSGAIGFYGRTGDREGYPGPIQRAEQMQAPILALQAGADAHITAEDNAAFDQALTDAGVQHEIVEYPGAPHSFFDRKQDEFAEASEDAWNRVLAFVEKYR